jgi:hypothetical protein
MTMMRRELWLLLAGFGLLTAVVYFLFWPNPLHVIIYNDTDRPFARVTVTLGSQSAEYAPLQAEESISLGFTPVQTATDINLIVKSDPPVTWSAPFLADPDVARITLRVGASNSVIFTVEPTWRKRLQFLLNQISVI